MYLVEHSSRDKQWKMQNIRTNRIKGYFLYIWLTSTSEHIKNRKKTHHEMTPIVLIPCNDSESELVETRIATPPKGKLDNTSTPMLEEQSPR